MATELDPRNPFGVKAGQVWQDADPRSEGRYLKIRYVLGVHIEDTPRALCEQVNSLGSLTSDRIARVLLSRFNGNSNGCKLVRDVPEQKKDNLNA